MPARGHPEHQLRQRVGRRLTVDGSFGAYTNEATRNFQACVHIAVDGIIGPNTWSKLNYWVNQSTYACAAA